MATALFTPFSKANHNVPNVKLTPSNHNPTSQFSSNSSRPGNRSPHKSSRRDPPPPSDVALSLKRVIGCSTTAFDCHAGSRSFAYTAGAAAVVVQLDEHLKITQRFYRARPNAPSLSLSQSPHPLNSTPSNETRTKSSRESTFGCAALPGPLGSPFFGMDDPSARTWTARERVKAATSVSFSPDGKWLAVGETGYNPRILIFSTAKDAPCDRPVVAMAEHTFGVRKVAFSPCSKYLASIGTINDGFVYIWALTGGKNVAVRLHSSNKCTSLVKDIAWMGKNLVTVGTRHVKIWRTDDDQRPHSPGPRVLHGRNAILGPLSDCIMTCVVGLSDDRAMVCSEKGDICLLDDTGQRLTKVANAEFGVSCVAIDADKKFAWVAGKNGNIRPLVLTDIVPSTPPISPSSSRSSSPVIPDGGRPANVMAMGAMGGHLITLDTNRSIKVISMTDVENVPVPNTMIQELPAHKDSVMGVRLIPSSSKIQAAFYTWSAGGSVMFWDLEGRSKGEFEVELEQLSDMEDELPNELKVVRVAGDGSFFVSGDRYGVLRILEDEGQKCVYAVKAHASEFLDASIYQNENMTLLATCGRDRVVQVFAKVKGEWSLAQTLDDHSASVSRVLFMDAGKRLLSCSTDRTVVVRQLADSGAITTADDIIYLQLRKYSLKASPVHMTPLSDSSSMLMISTMDRQISKYDLTSGKSIQGFRAADESGDAVVMDALTLSREGGGIGKGGRWLIGVSTTDKSIRLYDLDGNLVEKEWGHTEGVTDIALLESNVEDENTTDMLISTGTDGTIMVWEFAQQKSKESADVDLPSAQDSIKELMASRAPLRKVISKADLVARSPEMRAGAGERAATAMSGEVDNKDKAKTPELRASTWSESTSGKEPEKRLAAGGRTPELRPQNSMDMDKTASESEKLGKDETPTQRNKPKSTPQTQTPNLSPPRTIRRKTSNISIRARALYTAQQSTPTPSTMDKSLSMSFPGLTPTPDLHAPRPRTATASSRSSRDRSPSPKAPGSASATSTPTNMSAVNTPTPTPAPTTTSRRPSADSRTTSSSRAKSTPTTSSTAIRDPAQLTSMAETLARSLRSFRRKLEATRDREREKERECPGSSVDCIRPEALRDLERELGLTRRVCSGISGNGNSPSHGHSTNGGGDKKAGEAMMAQMLDVYSERLMGMLAERLDASGRFGESAASRAGSGSEAEGESEGGDATETMTEEGGSSGEERKGVKKGKGKS